MHETDSRSSTPPTQALHKRRPGRSSIPRTLLSHEDTREQRRQRSSASAYLRSCRRLILEVEILPPVRIRRPNHPHNVTAGVQREGSRLAAAASSVSSCSISEPLRRLHSLQHATRFSHVDAPPRDLGTTWSSVNSAAVSTTWQYWHVFLSRSKMFFRESALRLVRNPAILQQPNHAQHLDHHPVRMEHAAPAPLQYVQRPSGRAPAPAAHRRC